MELVDFFDEELLVNPAPEVFDPSTPDEDEIGPPDLPLFPKKPVVAEVELFIKRPI